MIYDVSIAAPGAGVLELGCLGGRSAVRRAYAASPLRLLMPRSHGNAAWVYTSSYGGGLLGGDALSLGVTVDAGARAFLSSQASTKVYRSAEGASLRLDARVGAGGLLVVWPDPVVPFAGSSFEQRQAVDLDADAGLVIVDWMTSGRRRSGERWQFRRYASRLTIRYAGRLSVVDALRLDAGDGDLAARMDRFDVVCTAVVVGPPVSAHAAAIVAAEAGRPADRRPDLLCAASPVSGGCIVRMLGRSVEAVDRALRERLSFVPCLLGDDPWARKW